jgi:mono/diheme cytochrome c family protein
MRNPTSSRWVVLLALFVSAGGLYACDSDPIRPEGVPESHTAVKGNAFHMPGLRAPEENCVQCHGADLMGGANGEPSCYSCHGEKWD